MSAREEAASADAAIDRECRALSARLDTSVLPKPLAVGQRLYSDTEALVPLDWLRTLAETWGDTT